MLTVGQVQNFLNMAQKNLELIVKTPTGYYSIEKILFASTYDNEYGMEITGLPNQCVILEAEE